MYSCIRSWVLGINLRFCNYFLLFDFLLRIRSVIIESNYLSFFFSVPARSSFVDDNLHNENGLNASGRNWQSQMEGINFSCYGNELSDSAFEFPHLHKNRYSTNMKVLCHIFCTVMCRFLRMFL